MKRLALPREMLRLFVAVAVILATSLILQGAVSVTADETLPTKAKVSADGVAPIIECKWELPDMAIGDGTRNPFPDATFEYGTNGDIHRHDDAARTPHPVNPCHLPATGTPSMASGARNMIDLMPNPGDLPELRRFQVWMAVDHPNGISNIDDVYWDIFHPDCVETVDESALCGKLKQQVHGIKIARPDCGLLGNSSTAGTMFEAAVHSGQISAAAVDDPNRGMIALCHEQVKAIYYSEWTMSKEQPCGDYRVEANAVSHGTRAEPIVNYFHVICFIHGELDFTTLDWGGITPGLSKVLPGNLIFDDPAGNTPTVRNIGNIGLKPAVRFDEMCSTTLPGKKCIEQFDTAFGRSAATLQYIDPIFAGQLAEFGSRRAQVLCADEVGKIDFSVHPPNTLPADAYEGGVEIIFQQVRGVCSTDQEPLLEVIAQ